MADSPDRETVILFDPTGGVTYFAEVPSGAKTFRAPNLDRFPPEFRGQVFDRRGKDRNWGLPRFRRRSRRIR